MILKLLSNIQILWMLFIKLLKKAIGIKIRKILIAFDGMIADKKNSNKIKKNLTQ